MLPLLARSVRMRDPGFEQVGRPAARPRPLRLDAPGSLGDVMCRGIERDRIGMDSTARANLAIARTGCSSAPPWVLGL
jgi:hypothetical protein